MKINSYKKFNIKLFKIFVTLILFIGLLNYIVNPYNIFDNKFFCNLFLKPEAKVQERYTKFIALKLDKRKIDTVFLGTSRADLALSKIYYKKLTDNNAENLAMGDFYVYEFIDVFKKLILIHPEVKKIYVGIDFAMFKKNRNDDNKYTRYKISEIKNITSSELGFSFLSLKSTGNSIWTVIKNLMRIENRMFTYEGTKHIFVNPDIENEFKDNLDKYSNTYKKFELDNSLFKLLKQLKNMCEERNINITFFIMPSHITDEYLIYKNCFEEYEKWKIELTKIADIYDFQYPNVYSEEKISPDMKYFFESSHSTYLLGNIILDVLMGKNKEFGHLLTKDNVETQVIKDRNELVKFFKNNKSFDKFIKIDKEQIK